MKGFALFLGCNIPYRLTAYENASRAVLGVFDIKLNDIEAFNCCGYPLRNIDFKAFVLLSARNLALAAQKGVDVVVLCQCCFGALKKAQHLLDQDGGLRRDVNVLLGKEGLNYEGGIEVKHLLQVFFHDLGTKVIKGQIRHGLKGLKVAVHYGCHVLRPSAIVCFDDPVSPTIFEELVGVTGAECVTWQRRLDCCGAPLRGVNDKISHALAKRKLDDAHAAGGDCLCVACPYCQIQFDTIQKEVRRSTKGRRDHIFPIILYPQLLGLSLGLKAEALGLDGGGLPTGGLIDRLSSGRKVNKVRREVG